MPFELRVQDIKCMFLKLNTAYKNRLEKESVSYNQLLRNLSWHFVYNCWSYCSPLITTEITEIQANFHITLQLAKDCHKPRGFSRCPQSPVAQEPWWDACSLSAPGLGLGCLLCSTQPLPFSSHLCTSKFPTVRRGIADIIFAVFKI